MRNRAGAIVSIGACALFLAVLAWPSVVKPPSAITTYYSWGILSPLFAGVLVAVIPLVFAVTRNDRLSSQVGAGIALALALFAVFLTSAWAVTARLDVFRAPGWALPAQRFVLVAFSVLVVIGVAWHARATDLLALR